MFDGQFCSENATYNVKCNTANSVESSKTLLLYA